MQELEFIKKEKKTIKWNDGSVKQFKIHVTKCLKKSFSEYEKRIFIHFYREAHK
jgi:hypothetical protein